MDDYWEIRGRSKFNKSNVIIWLNLSSSTAKRICKYFEPELQIQKHHSQRLGGTSIDEDVYLHFYVQRNTVSQKNLDISLLQTP